MRERPILFSGAMVRAILAGTKTQTRRVVKDGPWNRVFRDAMTDAFPPPQYLATREDGTGRFLCCPYGQRGDRLWVRETWGAIDNLIDGFEREDATCIGYRADLSGLRHEGEPPIPLDVASINWDRVRWRPSIHMPRWASRLTLAVESIRVERLNDISEEDARAEGVEPCRIQDARGLGIFRDSFANLWDSINGKRQAPAHIRRRKAHDKPVDRYEATHPEKPTSYSWQANPWVWLVGFSVAEVRS